MTFMSHSNAAAHERALFSARHVQRLGSAPCDGHACGLLAGDGRGVEAALVARYVRWLLQSQHLVRDPGRYEMCALPEARPLLSLLAQRAAPSRPLSPWLTPASYRPAACQPIKSLHHVIDDAQRTERT